MNAVTRSKEKKKALQGRPLTSFSSLLEACISTDCLTSLRCFADIKRFQSVGVFCVRRCIESFDLFQSTLTFVCHGQATNQDVLLYRQAFFQSRFISRDLTFHTISAEFVDATGFYFNCESVQKNHFFLLARTIAQKFLCYFEVFLSNNFAC